MEDSRENPEEILLLRDDKSEGNVAEKKRASRWSETRKTIFLFYMLGFLVCFLAGVVLTAAEDVLENDEEPTGTIWIVYTTPFLLFTVYVSFIFDRVPTCYLVVSFFPLMVIGIGALCLVDIIWIKYAGVFLIGTTDCVSEVTAVALTAYFDRITVMAFCLGSGVSYVMGPLYYTAMTSWFHVHPKIVLTTLVLHPIGFLVCYNLLEKRRDQTRLEGFFSADGEKLDKVEYLSLKSKFRYSCQFLPKIFQIFVSFTLNDLVVSGITTTIAFENSWLSPANHYKYYLMSSFGGLFLGRSYLGIVELIKPGIADKILIQRTWLLVALTAGHVVLFVFASLFRFLPNVWVTMILVFSLGFWSEATYSNINVILGELGDNRVRELSLGLSVYGVGLGNLIGSVVSGFVEKPLLEHCVRTVADSRLCFTRNVDVQDMARH